MFTLPQQKQDIERVAKAIYWATCELHGNPAVEKMGKDQAWQATSSYHRRLCRGQAVRAIQAMGVEPVVGWDARLPAMRSAAPPKLPWRPWQP